MKTFMNITNYRSKSNNPLTANSINSQNFGINTQYANRLPPSSNFFIS